MIQSNELRIGNYVQCGLGSHEQVVSISRDSVETIGGANLYDDITGIELTPDVMKKVNHTFDEPYYSITTKDGQDGLMARATSDGIYFEYEANFGASYDLKIEFLHQLQNLFFALKGEELKIDL